MSTQDKTGLRERILSRPHDALMKNIWKNLKEEPTTDGGLVPAGNDRWQFVMLNLHWDDIYSLKLTRRDYYRIAKFAAQKFGDTEGHRVRSDVLSSRQYYTICKIMAEQGVLWSLDYEKLQKASNFGISNPVVDIILTVSNNTYDKEKRKVLLDYLFKDKNVGSALLESKLPQVRKLQAQFTEYVSAAHRM